MKRRTPKTLPLETRLAHAYNDGRHDGRRMEVSDGRGMCFSMYDRWLRMAYEAGNAKGREEAIETHRRLHAALKPPADWPKPNGQRTPNSQDGER